MQPENTRKKRKKILAAVLLVLVLIAVGVYAYLAGFFGTAKVAQYDYTKLGVFFLDVGQGDAILLRAPDDRFMLIDAGPPKSDGALIKALGSYGVKKLEYLILTHPDEDHIGGAVAVLDALEVRTVLTGDAGAANKLWTDVIAKIDEKGCAFPQVSLGGSYDFFENCRFTVLGPVDGDSAANTNDQSLVIRLDYGAVSCLFTGDAEKAEERAIIEYFGADALRADLIKLGHHGSASSTSAELLDAVRPIYAVASCGKDNAYGHPHASVLKALENAGVEVYRTDKDGTVIFQSDGKTIAPAVVDELTPFERLMDRIKHWFT